MLVLGGLVPLYHPTYQASDIDLARVVHEAGQVVFPWNWRAGCFSLAVGSAVLGSGRRGLFVGLPGVAVSAGARVFATQ